MMASKNMFLENIYRTGKKGKIPVIAEIKPYSPSCGDLLRGRRITEIAKQYRDSGAACISIVTGKWYGGNTGMLEQLADILDLPILRKDFITSKKQVQLSKKLGASAVLLTKKLLCKEHLQELADYCLSIDLIPFIEVSSKDELAGLKFNSNSIVAVNNRDIMIKETCGSGIDKSLCLVDEAKKSGAALTVSASGISTRAEAHRLIHSGFDALLIGTVILQAEDIKKTLTDFTARS